ncbi:MAG: MFS transporter [Gammaproteobacteria bacterium]|nr:MFS transporter [Gammaproteobacteria bacterium]
MHNSTSAIDSGETLRRNSAYTVGLFTVLYMLMYVDRNIVNLLLESIKADLKLSDTMLALIAGFGFSFFHTVFGLPAARWADRSDRRIIITLSTALWSGMTLLCGFVQNGLQLALARIGVGIGEATTPVLHSILSDSSTKDSRARVMSILIMGSPLAALFCYPVIGWFETHHGWRSAFIVAGIPGLIAGAVVWFTFRDRAREAARNHVKGYERTAPPVREVLRFLRGQRTFLCTAAGYVISQIGIIGFTVWAPTYLRRVHEMSPSEVGISFGLITGIVGLLGALSGAVILERSNRYGDRWKLLWPALATFLAAPAILAATFFDSVWVTLGGMGMVAFMAAFKFGPVLAVNQSVVRPRMRALASSLQGFTASIVAIGGGPIIVGAISDALTPEFGADGLRYGVMCCAVFATAGSILLAYGSRFIEADIRLAEAVD